MQDAMMIFDPEVGSKRPYPSLARHYREEYPGAKWYYDPWTGRARHPSDIESDPDGRLLVPSPFIDWDAVHSDYKWLAMDKHGDWYLYQSRPEVVGMQWIDTLGSMVPARAFKSFRPVENCDWKRAYLRPE